MRSCLHVEPLGVLVLGVDDASDGIHASGEGSSRAIPQLAGRRRLGPLHPARERRHGRRAGGMLRG